jgi:glycosyltransferase involved in cell wall biosynthesis
MLQSRKFKVSIIIPCLNEEKYIGDLLSNLENQIDTGSEIIVVDGNSKDKTIKIIRKFPKVKLLKGKPQVATQRHKGAIESKTDTLVFLDADTKLPAKFLSSSLKEFNQRGLKIACPFYLPYPYSFSTFIIYIIFDLLFLIFQKIFPSGAGSCVIVQKTLYKKTGGFDPKYKFDDIQFIRRASKYGRFGILKQFVYVSDRRFREYGNLSMLLTYLILSALFMIGAFKLANRVPYSFNYKK